MMIDTHAHLNLAEFSGDYKDVITRSLESGVSMINIGVNYESSLRAVGIAGEYNSGVWAAIGLHPENIDYGFKKLLKKEVSPENIKEPDFNDAIYRELAQSSKKVVAIGEIGLDYLHLPKDEAKASLARRKQAEIFKSQLEFSRGLGLPVIIHTRLAHGDTIGILREFAGAEGKVNGVIHCFTGSIDDARQYCELGLYFGLNGIIFKLDLDEAVKSMPLERILLETDCPFLSPPFAGVKRNEPVYVKDIAARVAQIRNEPVQTITAAATANAKKLFKI